MLDPLCMGATMDVPSGWAFTRAGRVTMSCFSPDLSALVGLGRASGKGVDKRASSIPGGSCRRQCRDRRAAPGRHRCQQPHRRRRRRREGHSRWRSVRSGSCLPAPAGGDYAQGAPLAARLVPDAARGGARRVRACFQLAFHSRYVTPRHCRTDTVAALAALQFSQSLTPAVPS